MVIRTQQEFDAISSLSELPAGIHSILIVGQAGKARFNCDGWKLPTGIRHLSGIGDPIIISSGFKHGNGNEAVLHGTTDMHVTGIAIIDDQTSPISQNLCGFKGFGSVSNCQFRGRTNGIGIGFAHCRELIDCSSEVFGSSYGCAFDNCIGLVNCHAFGRNGPVSGGGNAYGFSSCTGLTNCDADITTSGAGNGYGFNSCTMLTNCTGTASIANSTDSCAFYSCKYLNACRRGSPMNVNFLGGSNAKVDTTTCDANGSSDGGGGNVYMT